MLHFQNKAAIASSEELSTGLTTVIRTTYGMFAAAALTSDSVALRRAREAAVGKKKVSNVIHIEGTELEHKMYERLRNKQKLQGLLLEMIQQQTKR